MTMTMLIELPDALVARLPDLRKVNPGLTDPEIVVAVIRAAHEHNEAYRSLSEEERAAILNDGRRVGDITVRELGRLLGMDNAHAARVASANSAEQAQAMVARVKEMTGDIDGLRHHLAHPIRLRNVEARRGFLEQLTVQNPESDLVIFAAWAAPEGYIPVRHPSRPPVN